MDDRYLDVLDASGRTPRESGAVQFFAETCVQDPSGAAMLTLYLQAAYEPYSGGTLTLYAEGLDGAAVLSEEQSRFELPPLPSGRVVRWDLPLRFRSRAKLLTVELASPPGKKAARVRQAWKVFRTQRAPTNDELDGVAKPPPPETPEEPLGAFFGAIGQALSAAFGGGPPPAEPPVAVKLPVIDGVPTPMTTPTVEKLWELGEPMPSLARPRELPPADDEQPEPKAPGQPGGEPSS